MPGFSKQTAGRLRCRDVKVSSGGKITAFTYKERVEPKMVNHALPGQDNNTWVTGVACCFATSVARGRLCAYGRLSDVQKQSPSIHAFTDICRFLCISISCRAHSPHKAKGGRKK